MSQEQELSTPHVIHSNELLGATERAVAQVWSEILEIPLPAANDEFLALGGDSMTMVLTEFRLMEEFPVQLPDGAMFAARTVRELAALIDARLDQHPVTAASCAPERTS